MKIPNSVNFTPSLIFKMGNFIWRASALLNPMNCKRKLSQCAYHVQILYCINVVVIVEVTLTALGAFILHFCSVRIRTCDHD